MVLKRGSGASCTAQRLEELFSSTRTERSLADARTGGSTMPMPATGHRQPLPFPAPHAREPFLTRVKKEPFQGPSPAARQEDGLRHYRVESGGEDVETSVFAFLAIFVSCTWLLFWVISQFVHIMIASGH